MHSYNTYLICNCVRTRPSLKRNVIHVRVHTVSCTVRLSWWNIFVLYRVSMYTYSMEPGVYMYACTIICDVTCVYMISVLVSLRLYNLDTHAYVASECALLVRIDETKRNIINFVQYTYYRDSYSARISFISHSYAHARTLALSLSLVYMLYIIFHNYFFFFFI